MSELRSDIVAVLLGCSNMNLIVCKHTSNSRCSILIATRTKKPSSMH